jgi:hypothetical protein
LIFVPRKVHVQGINYSEAAWSFRDPEVGEYVITEAGHQRASPRSSTTSARSTGARSGSSAAIRRPQRYGRRIFAP